LEKKSRPTLNMAAGKRSSVIEALPDGRSALTMEDGAKYTGAFKDHKFHGLGELRWADGVTLYKGEYVEGAMHGRGTLKTKAGTYEGPFVNNKMHGQGTFTYEDGSVYVGGFENGERSGAGTLSYGNKSKYVGKFKVRGNPCVVGFFFPLFFMETLSTMWT
jgi:hypothetical protein